MSFNPNIPQAADIPAQSQGQLLTNFQQLNSIFSQNHVTWNDATVSERGKHTVVEMQSQGATPTPSGTNISIYNAQAADLTQQLFMVNSSGIPVQITGAGSPGSSFEFRAGTFTSVAGITTVTFSSPFPNSIISVVCQPRSNSSAWYVNTQGTNNFTLATSSSILFNYIAIGN